MSTIFKIKNFGPIKNIELNLNKVNILIGEQGTGKSALTKLLYVLSNANFLLNRNDEERVRLLDSYGLFFKRNTEIEYKTSNFHVTRKNGKFHVDFIGAKDIEISYKFLKSEYKASKDDLMALREWNIFKKWMTESGRYMYVPAERIALTTTLRLIRDTPNRNIYERNFDQYVLDFAIDYDAASMKVKEFKVPHLKNVSYYRDNDLEKVNFNGDSLFLYQTSSGFQVSIPITVLLEWFTKDKKNKNQFILEEPEMNLFPAAQYDLIKFFIEKINPVDSTIFVTTHSPYVLTSLNNLIQGYVVGSMANKQKKVSSILPKKYWLNPKNVTATALKYDKAGKVVGESILDEDGLIKAEKIDGISNWINNEYDRILEVKYGK